MKSLTDKLYGNLIQAEQKIELTKESFAKKNTIRGKIVWMK